MRYYWEVLFSTEYFPYWEFTMLMMLCLQLSMLWRMHRVEKKIDVLNELSHHIIDEVEQLKKKLMYHGETNQKDVLMVKVMY